MADSSVDPITLEVIKNALASTADEMALVIMRSAYSPVVRDTMDYSTALCDRNGRVVAQGLTLAVQLGTFPTVMGYVLEEFGSSALPGDVYIANDPYGCGGQHLPDLYVIKPIFVGETLEGWAATMAHHSDVGGIAPGSVAVHATEIYQEGLRIPLSKLYDGGVENTTLMRLIEANTRQPIHVLGDLRAQLAACRVAERGLTALLERYGPAAHDYMDELQRVAERIMRAELAKLPDGVHEFTDWIDGVGEDPVPIAIVVRVEIAGDEILIDFEGTAAQIDASVNCPVGMVRAACYCAIRGIVGAEIPNCEGYMTPIRVNAPAGTVVNPVLPAACGARGVVGYRVYDALMGALAPLVPDRVLAAGEGGPTLIAFGGYEIGDDGVRRPFGTTEVIVGTWGARSQRDGLEGVSNPLANLGNQPVELLEADIPIAVEHYGLVPDSGGAGRQRGGLAYVRSFRVLADRATLTIRTDRRDHPPYGLDGGAPGAPSRNTVVAAAGATRELPTMPMEAYTLVKGDRFTHVAAGGGGFGRPDERDPAAVLEDVLDGKVSIEAARESYGVVIADGVVDDGATALAEELALSIDLAIRNGLVVDGTGGEPRPADIGIDDGRIVAIGELPEADREIDAAGKVVAPGFIDIHSHSDYTLLVDPRASSAVHQGVTLEVVGNCGFGCFPLLNKELAPKAIYGHSDDVPLTWTSAAGYFERLEEAAPAINVLSLVPNGQLRLSVVGLADRPARPDELAQMTYLLDEALEQGAWGYSTGLEYASERGADEDELVHLCTACGRRHGIYATHTRRRDEGADEAVAEALRTGERSGARLQVSHLIPRNGLESARRCVELVDEAAASGLDVAFDMHTRLYGTTFLLTALPPWALDDPSRLRTILGSAEQRRAMRDYESILSAGGDWSRIVLLDNDVWPDYARRDIASIAAERGQDPLDAVYDLLLGAADRHGTEGPGRLMVIIHAYTEEQQREAFAHPLCVPGSDATTMAPDGPLAGKVFHGAYTWAAWFLRFSVQQESILSLPDAIHRLTGAPADRLGLTDRGVLRPGAHADVVVFDPLAFREEGTTFEPSRLATGMDTVIVNGAVTLSGGEPTGTRAGRVLRRP